MMTSIRTQLEQLADADYRKFTAGLLPATDPILGVRLPQLRALAKQLSRADWRAYLQTAQDHFLEEIMLQGMVIGYAKCTPDEHFQWTQWFVPKIHNWSVCDSFCTGLKFTEQIPEQTWEFLQPYLHSTQEFEIRFAVVMLLLHFRKETQLPSVLHALDSVQTTSYYAKMAVAWAVSACYTRFPEQTLPFLRQNHLDTATHNKSLQKIIESRKVSKEQKEQIRAMKR